jgi:hypothetical protein
VARIFTVEPNGRATPVDSVLCQNEERELQELLEKCPDVLPGDQINPDDPCRWLVVGRELPVPNPSTGVDHWSIDVVLADQNAIPTLIECKRFEDTRSRREVVGQMLDYAANGHQYWTAEQLEALAARAAKAEERTLPEALTELDPSIDRSPQEFFAAFVSHLREGRVRLVFFLEEAPFELKSIVEFLNGQMERAEVLIVEARQFNIQGRRVVSPSLFGFTESARRAKRAVLATEGRRRWDAKSFLAAAKSTLHPVEARALDRVLAFAHEQGCQVSWGSGKINGSVGLVWPDLCRRSVISVYTDGSFVLNLGWLDENERQLGFRSELAERLTEEVGATMPPNLDGRFPNLPRTLWTARVEKVLSVLSEVVERHRKADSRPYPDSER